MIYLHQIKTFMTELDVDEKKQEYLLFHKKFFFINVMSIALLAAYI